jgi:hypothetical protein
MESSYAKAVITASKNGSITEKKVIATKAQGHQEAGNFGQNHLGVLVPRHKFSWVSDSSFVWVTGPLKNRREDRTHHELQTKSPRGCLNPFLLMCSHCKYKSAAFLVNTPRKRDILDEKKFFPPPLGAAGQREGSLQPFYSNSMM